MKLKTELGRRIHFALLLLTPVLFLSATHVGPSYDTRPRKSLDRFAKEFSKKHHLTFLNSGVGALADAKKSIWAVHFTSAQALTIEQARPLVKELTYQLLYKIYHDPLFAKYCEKSPYADKSELKDEYAAFKLAFWDENTNRPLYPYLAQIRLADNCIYYHYANPETQALQEPIIESLESLQLPSFR